MGGAEGWTLRLEEKKKDPVGQNVLLYNTYEFDMEA